MLAGTTMDRILSILIMLTRPPRIGITCDTRELGGRRGNSVAPLLVPRAYADAVFHAGGLPLLLPVVEDRAAAALLDGLDALVVSGGGFDVPPAYYGEQPQPGLGPLNLERSAIERALLNEALTRRLPCLGVCGGMQLLNVVCGGTLYQDLSHRPGTDTHVQPTDPKRPHHEVVLQGTGCLAGMWPEGRLQVNSTHHQAVKTLGPAVTCVATSPDGVIEAIEVQGQPFAVGVQWHPEALATPLQQRVYEALVIAARNRLHERTRQLLV